MASEQTILLWVEYKHVVPWLYGALTVIAAGGLLLYRLDPASEPQSRFEIALVRAAEAVGPFFIALLLLCGLAAYLWWEFPPSN